MFFVLLVVFAAILGALMTAVHETNLTPAQANAEQKERTEEADKIAAYEEAKSECLRNLKAPSTADFSTYNWSPNTGAKKLTDNTWLSAGYVDAQNSFGAKIRENWTAVVRRDGDRWTVLYLKIGDKEEGDRSTLP